MNRNVVASLSVAACAVAIAWSWAMSGGLLLLKTGEVIEEKTVDAPRCVVRSGVLREALHRRIDDPSFWIYIGAGLASAVLLGFVVVRRLNLQKPRWSSLGNYGVFVAVGITAYIAVTAIKGEALFWRPDPKYPVRGAALALTNMPRLQRIEGILNIVSIVVLYCPSIVVAQLTLGNQKGVKYLVALRAQMNTALIPLSLFALVFFSLTILPRFFGFTIIDEPTDYLTGLAGAALLLLPYLWVAIRAARASAASKATLHVFKIIPVLIYLVWLGLSATGKVPRPSSSWITNASAANPPWNHALGIADFFGLLGFFLFAWIW